ncbi:MAG: carboxypeptidase regulatory-like domain-containing protein [Acidobacteriota bacterium]
MRARNRITIFIATILVAAIGPHAQSGAQDQKATCSVTGTVTLKGKPARGVKVMALQNGASDSGLVAIDFTDASGHYHLKGIRAGSCRITLDAPSFTTKDGEDDRDSLGKWLTLDEGENIEGIDLKIMPGGVIMGRAIEANGRPVIDGDVEIVPFKDGSYEEFSFSKASTDDRGVYRAYGLPPGRYRVGVANSPMSSNQVRFPRTYYPGVTDKSKAEMVEVAAGGEVTSIDIKVNRRPKVKTKTKTYAVTGRLVDAQTGSPIPQENVFCEQKPNLEDNKSGDFEELFRDVKASDSKGEFRMDGLHPGKYKIQISDEGGSLWYGEGLAFEISTADVAGLEIKVYRAGSISGVVVLEGATDAAAAATLSRLRINDGSRWVGEPLNKDGSFHLTGVTPGSRSLSIHPDNWSEDFQVIRIERDGVPLNKVEQTVEGIEVRRGAIEVAPGENVSGVRVVVACYKGVVRGQIKIEGGTLPKGASLNVSATPTNKPKQDGSWFNNRGLGPSASGGPTRGFGGIDARGRFVIDSLPPGEYEISLDVFPTPQKDDGSIKPSMTVTKIVSLTEGAEVEITLVLDLSKKPQEKRQ